MIIFVNICYKQEILRQQHTDAITKGLTNHSFRIEITLEVYNIISSPLVFSIY